MLRLFITFSSYSPYLADLLGDVGVGMNCTLAIFSASSSFLCTLFDGLNIFRFLSSLPSFYLLMTSVSSTLITFSATNYCMMALSNLVKSL